ncbi:HRDC domain-containing protein [Clostridium saccharobutylicum]|uniref:Ribonuclease D n=1 Tax=Clostridium saccharobutylicum TaxID=169679 RepID=A0A1S8MNC4_CLOSA|nr:HRDC domain-containing protein [Clostridium saccharobutylicum]OOM05680.1 ribonuclease D [Clostridium saccharobutylicum]
MGFLNTMKEAITKKPSTLREPNFIKKFKEDNGQVEELEKLLNIVPNEISKQIEQDMKLLRYGISGEKNVAYELSNSHMPILILYDLNVEYKGLKAQIDYVVIDSRFILVIECKNMVGDIEITNSGDFIRSFKGSNGRVYKKEGIYSPIVQNERHVEVIKDILKGEELLGTKHLTLIKQVVTVANPKTVINSKYAKKEIKEHIIKHEQLINTMKVLHEANKDGYWLTEETMYKVADCLMKYNSTHKFDYEKKYGISSILKEDVETFKNEDKEENFKEITTKIEIDNTKEETINKEEASIYKELKEYRLNKSREEKVKPYFLYNNQELEEIIRVKPKTIDELKEIRGFGDVKCEKYGLDIINIINRQYS